MFKRNRLFFFLIFPWIICLFFTQIVPASAEIPNINVELTCPNTNCNAVVAGSQIQVFIANYSDDDAECRIYMSKGSRQEDFAQKGAVTAKAHTDGVIATVSTTTDTTREQHYIRVVCDKKDTGARIGLVDNAITVVSPPAGNTNTITKTNTNTNGSLPTVGNKNTNGGGTGGNTNLGRGGITTLGVSLPKPTGTGSINDLINRVINWLLELASALAVLAIVYSGIMYITSADNEEQAKKAKKNLIWAIIAIVIISLALLIPQWVINAI